MENKNVHHDSVTLVYYIIGMLILRQVELEFKH